MSVQALIESIEALNGNIEKLTRELNRLSKPKCFWLPTDSVLLWRDAFEDQINNFNASSNINSETFVPGYSKYALEATFNKANYNPRYVNIFPYGVVNFDELAIAVKFRYPDVVEQLRFSVLFIFEHGDQRKQTGVVVVKYRDDTDDSLSVGILTSGLVTFGNFVAVYNKVRDVWHDLYVKIDLRNEKINGCVVDYVDIYKAWSDAGIDTSFISGTSDGKKRFEMQIRFYSDGSSAETNTMQFCDCLVYGIGGIYALRTQFQTFEYPTAGT